MARTPKLVYWIDPNYNDLSGRVKNWLEYKFYLSGNRTKKIMFKDLCRVFYDVHPRILLTILDFLDKNGYCYIDYDKKMKDFIILREPRVSKKEKAFWENMHKVADQLGGFNALWEQVLKPSIEKRISENEQ
ncbi:MAG: hypothetical protein ACPLZG_12665 [Thermoproteota archaeon]